MIEKGECDFVAEVAGEMPSYVIAELMGLPLDDGRELYKLTEIIHSAPETLLPAGAGGEAVGKMFAYGMQVIAEKRARPADDLATRLLQAEVDGKRLTDPEFLLYFLLLIDAGGDTTRNLLSAGLLALHENPDQLAWLMADLPTRLPSAREELLRYTSPVIYCAHGDSRHPHRRHRHQGRRQGGDVFQRPPTAIRTSSTGPIRSTCRAILTSTSPSAAARTSVLASIWLASKSTPSWLRC